MRTQLASPLRLATAGDNSSFSASYSPIRRHRWGVLLAAFWIALAQLCPFLRAAEPIRLHPDNPHYFLFRGKAHRLGDLCGALRRRPQP